jgi:hypothetical protein
LESGSRLARIDAKAFNRCSSLESIWIPRSIKELSKDWARFSSLHQVVFESALSLRIMLEMDKVDLSEDFEIKFVECDCALEFPGYFVQTVRASDDVIRLVKVRLQR